MADSDRTHLPIRRPSFAGMTDRTLDGSQPDWNLIGHPTPPAGAPNVLLVLIDDAGFGNPSTFGGPIQTPNYTRMAEQGHQVQPLPRHGALLAHPRRAAHRPEQPRRRVRVHRRVRRGLPRVLRHACRATARRSRGSFETTATRTAAFGKWHLTPDGQQGPAGPFDRWPNGWGFDYFYGILGGGSSQWDPCLAENQKIIGTPEEFYDEDEPVLLPRCDGRPRRSSGSTASARRTRRSRSSSTSRPGAAMRLITSRMRGRTSTRGSSIRAGTSSARRPSPARRNSASSRRRGAHAPRRRVPRVGRRARQAQAVLRPSDGGLRRVLRERGPQRRSRDRRDRGARRARQHLRHLDLGRQRRQHGRHPHRLVQRADDAERHPAHRRDAAATHRALRRHRAVG